MLFTSVGVGFSHAQTQETTVTDKTRGLNDSELDQVRDRLPYLIPGTTMNEVFEVIGINLLERADDISGSGPTQDYRIKYQLAIYPNERGYNLIIVVDEDRKFKRAEIVCWKESIVCIEANEKANSTSKEKPPNS